MDVSATRQASGWHAQDPVSFGSQRHDEEVYSSKGLGRRTSRV